MRPIGLGDDGRDQQHHQRHLPIDPEHGADQRDGGHDIADGDVDQPRQSLFHEGEIGCEALGQGGGVFALELAEIGIDQMRI